MARKNMFQGITPALRPDDAEMPTQPRSAPKMPEVFQTGGPIAAIRNDLRSLSSRSVQEIDPEMIEDTGLKDRLGSLDDDVVELRDSIAKHGQVVPILLRPHPTLSGRYQVIYGRRRLAAIRGLKTPVKALIRTLSDKEAVLAQGQENNFRKDPSFIEKALFAGDLEEAGYDAKVVQEALNVNRSHTSHMRKVREAFPRDVIERIGAAPSIGWKRWYELASRIQDEKIDATSVHPAPFPASLTSDQRFEAWSRSALTTGKKSTSSKEQQTQAVSIKAQDGSVIGTIALQKDKLSFQATSDGIPFTAWLHENAAALFPRLHEEFLARSVKSE
ncbi:MAG: plasmid partitioning protein RepB [Cypionkella sp.]|uniref:plasmid partitioning protein RepB n=1 Tax=Cypionkella sp. TaxID=2811411 RepID=UPI002AB868BB|nr:plasmid partitioning protein RepB [Cypionkella sp.]MDZ4311199.1 plasmid partitioning protein RepB [Cypionkella sp.]MDZ4393663.1 plasmid partitioning protein RepB [Cypionkella sp.]